MTCPEPVPDRTPLDPSRIDLAPELFARHIFGHRRLTDDYLEVVPFVLMNEMFEDTRWMWDILDGSGLPFTDVTYDVIEVVPPKDEPDRYTINRQVISDIETWLEAGNPQSDVGSLNTYRKALVLLLWGRGCGVDGTKWRSVKRRRKALTALLPGSPLLIEKLARDNSPGLTRDQVSEAFTEMQIVGGVTDLGMPVSEIVGQTATQVIRRALESGVIRVVQSTQPQTHTLAALDRDQIRHLKRDLQSATLTEDSVMFVESQIDRAIYRKLAGLKRPGTRSGFAEVQSLAATQQIIASVMVHHPNLIDRSASLNPFNDLPVYAKGYRREGHLSGTPSVLHDGTKNPQVGKTTRTPDGAIWTSRDRFEQPSILVEYEAGNGPLLVESHVELALWLSSRWKKTVTLLIVTSAVSHQKVRKDIRNFDAEDIAQKFHFDWPGANVDIRILKMRDAMYECPLHSSLAEEIHLSVSQLL